MPPGHLLPLPPHRCESCQRCGSLYPRFRCGR
ncbi:hypothetical protein GOM71_18045 [Paenibacillus sp. NEAU-GSW1]|nr:hypothetical protein [Paenibacillus sp. NEAU-GSW1]